MTLRKLLLSIGLLFVLAVPYTEAAAQPYRHRGGHHCRERCRDQAQACRDSCRELRGPGRHHCKDRCREREGRCFDRCR